MSAHDMVEVLKLLAPYGAVAIILGILALRAPQLIKELFSGVNNLLLTLQKIRRENAKGTTSSHSRRKPSTAEIESAE